MTALLLLAIAGPNVASAQTLMDYVVSRDRLAIADEVPPPPSHIPPPSDTPLYSDTPAVVPGSGWQTTTTCAVPVVSSCVADVPASCAAPAACRPRLVTSDVCYTAEPTCAVSSTPSRCVHAPAACKCQRNGCSCGGGSKCHGGSKRCGLCCCCSGWCRAHTTGDLYPHFPYLPEHGGTYYFRPYNWETVHQHIAFSTQLGLNTGNPYSVSKFNAINEEFAQRHPQGVSIPEPPLRLEKSLPKLEELLRPLP